MSRQLLPDNITHILINDKDIDFGKLYKGLNIKTNEIENNVTLLKPKNVDYILIKRLSAGAFGEVYKAYDIVNKDMVAIKFQIMHNKPEVDQQNLNLFLKEIEILKQISDICKFFICIRKHGIERNGVFIVMDFVDGMDLLEFMKKNKKLAEKNVFFIIIQIISVIKLLHKKGLAHMDIKPENIMIMPKTLQIRIIDLGLSCFTEICPMSGTQFYIPKDVKNDINSRKKADMWAIGIVLIQFIFGLDNSLYIVKGNSIGTIKNRILEVSTKNKINISSTYKSLIKKLMNINVDLMDSD